MALCALVGAAAAVVRQRRPHLVAVTAGIALYALYIVRIGGDFMIGRFLTVCVLGAVFVLSQVAWSFRTAFVASTAILIASLLAVPQTPLRATPEDRVAPGGGYQAHRGVADERAYYAARNGLLSRHRSAPRHGWVGRRDARARCVLPRESSGVAAFTAGPAVHVIDQLALSEPLLARLPARAVIFFRVGHVDRGVPPGYVETLATGRVAICDPTLAAYYERLHLVISGPLFTRGPLRGDLAAQYRSAEPFARPVRAAAAVRHGGRYLRDVPLLVGRAPSRRSRLTSSRRSRRGRQTRTRPGRSCRSSAPRARLVTDRLFESDNRLHSAPQRQNSFRFGGARTLSHRLAVPAASTI